MVGVPQREEAVMAATKKPNPFAKGGKDKVCKKCKKPMSKCKC
jgi:DTW domain-containing protein YfiP